MAILGFAGPDVERFFREGRLSKGLGWASVARVAARESARGPERGSGRFHSIRINDQWRVVFRWTDSGPAEVDVRDYH